MLVIVDETVASNFRTDVTQIFDALALQRGRHSIKFGFDFGDFGPPLGIAYRFNDKTVARGAYGLIWIEQAGITTPFTIPQFPFIQAVSQRTLGAPATVAGAAGFGSITSAGDPRVLQFGLKLNF